MTCLRDFQLDGNLSLTPGVNRTVTGTWLYTNLVRLIRQSTVASFSTMFNFELKLDRLYQQGMQVSNESWVEVPVGFGFIIVPDSIFHNYTLENQVSVSLQMMKGAQDSLYTRVDVHTPDWGGAGNLPWLGQALLLLDSIEVTMWIEYLGSTQMLDVFVRGTGDEKCGSTTLTNSTFICKPATPISSTFVNFTDTISQDGMLVGFGGCIQYFSGNTTNDFRINAWTFNSGGPAPDFPRDSNGLLVNPEKEKKDREGEEKRKMIRLLETALEPVVVILVLVFIICILYRRNARLTALAKKYDIDTAMLDRGPHSFKYRVLYTATKGFSSSELLGSGGFGSVYKGRLVFKGDQKPTEVAVKRISATSCQGAQEFLAEIKIIGRTQHRNLVQLLGWCHQRGELLLVYDYMTNGSLDQLLYRKTDHAQGEPVLTWTRRLRIVSGVATALRFLHEEWEHRVIHRDIKSSNVMLDHDFNARLGDFGLARMYEHWEAPPITAVLAGTYGYLAPELHQTLKFTEKTDVYSFGALVLEVATGKRPLLAEKYSRTYDDILLVDWVSGLYKDDKLLDATDWRLLNAYDQGEMSTFLKLGLLCSHPDPNERPSMRDVINIWKGSSPFPPLPRSRPVPVYPTIIPDGYDQPDESSGQSGFTITSRDDRDSLPPGELVGQKSALQAT